MISLPPQWEDWTVVRDLGRGSYSVVYEAAYRDDPSVRCAIKVIDIPHDDQEWDDLLSEGMTEDLSKSYLEEVIRSVTHEIQLMEHFKGMQNIVSIEDFKVVPKNDGIGSRIFIRMELLTSLDRYLSDKSLSDEEIAKLGIDLCTALEFCSDQKIVHRDIKPANIFVNDKLATRVFYKLGDFGIARNMENLSHGLSSKGTPNYMAPEIAANQPFDARADIYSLGLTLYWLANGKRLPFFPQSQLYTPAVKREALQRRLSGEKLPPPVNCSSTLADIIIKACDFNVTRRFQSATEMKQALVSFLSEASGDDSEKRPGIIRRHPWIVFPAAGVLLAGIGVCLFLLLPHDPEPAAFNDQGTAISSSTSLPETLATESEMPVTVSDTPDPMIERVEANRITSVYNTLQRRDSIISQWKKNIKPNRVVLPLEWNQIPFSVSPDQAPTLYVHIGGHQMEISMDDAESHNREVSISAGGEEWPCTWNASDEIYRITLADDVLPEEIRILVSYEQDNIRVTCSYEPADDDIPAGSPALASCTSVSSRLILDDGWNETEARRDGHNLYRVQAYTNEIHATYQNGKLAQYDDQAAGCVYNADGYLTGGDVPEGYISPVIVASDGALPRESSPRSMLKKLQAMKAGMAKVNAYDTDGHFYLPEKWETLPGSDISLLYAPNIATKKIGSGNALNIPLDERKWTVKLSDSSGVSQSGGLYYLTPSADWTICLELDSELEHEEGDDGVLCQATFSGNEKTGLQCTQLQYVYYQMVPFVSPGGSGVMQIQSLVMRDLWEPHDQVEYLDYMFTDFQRDSQLIVGTYLRPFGSQAARLTESLVLKDGEPYAYPALSSDRSAPCVRMPYENQLKPVEKAMDNDASWIRALAELKNDGVEVQEEYPVFNRNGESGEWTMLRIRNGSDFTFAIADIANPSDEDPVYDCYPGILSPGSSTTMIVKGDWKKVCFVRVTSGSVVSLQTELLGNRRVRITNTSSQDVYSLDWLYFTVNAQNAPEAAFMNNRGTDGKLMLSAGDSLEFSLEAEGVNQFYAWGYPRS